MLAILATLENLITEKQVSGRRRTLKWYYEREKKVENQKSIPVILCIFLSKKTFKNY